MITNCRFALDEKRYVIDRLNPANSGKGYCHEGISPGMRCGIERAYMEGRPVEYRTIQLLEAAAR
jgi:hypothetical protein